MSHVSEGMIHAYLDGALDEAAGREARAIREHLAQCSQCAARLEHETQVRAEAQSILEGALPRVELLPLEELRARAEATAPVAPRRMSRLYRLGWAASVVLAIGTGWMLRGQPAPGVDVVRTAEPAAAPVVNLLSRVDETPSSGQLVESFSEARVSEAAELQPPVVLEQRRRAVVGAASREVVAQGPPPVETMTDATPRAGLRALDDVAVTGLARARQLSEELREPTPAVTAPLDQPELEVPARQTAADLVALAASPEDTTTAGTGAEEAESDERLERTVATSALGSVSLTRLNWPTEDRRDRGDDGSEAQVVPGLELIFIEFLDAVPGVTRVLQSLGEGEELEILHVPEGVDPDAIPAFPADGKTGVIAPRNGGFVILRANRSVDELKILLDRLNGIS